MSANERAEGYYWVKYKSGKWVIALWQENDWVIFLSMIRWSDTYFEEIGNKIERAD